jgi:hypothetical protein
MQSIFRHKILLDNLPTFYSFNFTRVYTMSEGGNLVDKFKSKIAKTVGKKKKAPLTLADLEPVFLRLQQHLEKTALDVEGVFRVSGSADRINELKKAITKNPNEEIDLSQYDVHDVAGCLKQLLRKLHEPLIPFSLYGYLIHTAHEMSDDAKKRLTIIKAVITSSMPDTNKRVIKSLLFLLYAMQRKSKINKMTSENLSVVIGPSILRKEGEDLESMMRDSGSVVLIMRDMVEYFPFFYEEKPVNIEEPVNLNEKEKELIMTGEEHLDIVYDRVQKNYEEALKREKDLEARLNNEIKEKNVLETYIKMVEDQLGVEIATQLDLEKKLKASDAKLAEKTQETTKLSSTLDKTTKERDSIRTEVGSLKAEKEKLNTELSKEKKDRAAAIEEKNKLSAEMAKLKEELTAAKSENEKSKQAKDKALEEARKATEAKSAAETQLSADKKKLEGEVALLSQEKNKAVQDQSKYVQEVLKLTEEKNKLSAELTKSQSSTPNSNGKDNSNSWKKQIESLTQELEQSKEIRKKLQDEVASLKKPATDSPKRSNSNGSSSGAEGPVVAALKKQLESEQKTSEALRKQLNDLTSKRRGSSQASTIERAALEAKLSVLEEELAAKKKLDIELTNAKKELETLKSQAPSNNNTNDKEAEISKQIEAKYKQHITGLEKKMKNYNQLRDDLNRMRKQYGDAEKQRRQFEQQVITLKKQVQSLQNKAKNANNNNSNGSAAVSNGSNTLAASSEVQESERIRLKSLLFTWMSLALKLNMMATGKVGTMDKESVFQQIENQDPNTWPEVIMEQYNK